MEATDLVTVTKKGTIIDKFADEVSESILLKLPCKDLVRCKAVSKAWKHLISSHTFADRWFNSSSVLRGGNPCSSSFLVLRRRWRPEKENYFTCFSVSLMDVKPHQSDNFRLPFILPFISSDSGTESDNDTESKKLLARPLIYSAGFGIYCIFEFRSKSLALWNPTTRELKKLPWSPFNSKQKSDRHIYGFAHAEYKEGVLSYKVGLIRYRKNNHRISIVTIEIYSSSNHSWKRLKDCCRFERPPAPRVVYNKNGWLFSGTNLNGKFHWLNWLYTEDSYIVTFDISTENFGRLEVPHFIQHDCSCNLAYSILTILDEKYLCLLLFRGTDGNDGGETYLDVWIMMEYGIMESWNKKATVGPIFNPEYLDVLGVGNSIEGVFFQGMEKGDGLFFCRYGSEKVEKLLPIGSEDLEMMMIVEHKESIFSLNGTSDRRSKFLSC